MVQSYRIINKIEMSDIVSPSLNWRIMYTYMDRPGQVEGQSEDFKATRGTEYEDTTDREH